MLTTKARAFHAAAIPLLLLSGLVLWAAPPAPRGGASPSKERDAKLKALLAERLAVARDLAARVTKAYQAGTASLAEVHEADLAVLNAELDLCQRDKDRVTVLEKFVAAMKRFEEMVAQQHKAGLVPPSAPLKAKLARLEAEIALEHARAKAADPTK